MSGYKVDINEINWTNVEDGSCWYRDDKGEEGIHMRNGKSTTITVEAGTGDPYSMEDFMWVSAHEFGHILNVGDMYGRKDFVGVPSIMQAPDNYPKVTIADMEMVLKAHYTKQWQDWKMYYQNLWRTK